MRGLRSIVNKFRYIKANNAIIVSLFVLGLGAIGITQFTGANAAMRQDCSANAIMKCGAADANEFRTKYNQNAPGDLPAVYGHYYIPRDLAVVQGTSYKDGTVRVNGRIVAKNAESIGRQQLPGERPISIAGKTYFQGPNSTSFGEDALPTMVSLDAKGNFRYAVLNGCGNPIYATPVPPPVTPPTPPKPTPTYSCDSIYMQDLSNTQKRFTINASAAGGATISGYSINFGDGSSQNSQNKVIDHAYTKPGTYTITSTATILVNGQTKVAGGPQCNTQVTIKASGAYQCTALTLIDRTNNKYDFAIQETHSGTNVTYQGATLNYGDGKTDSITGNTASHQYDKAGNYTITATLSYNVDGAVKTTTCSTQITTAPTCPNDSNLPPNSPDCYCPYDSKLPKNSDKCQAPATPPAELPQTGQGNMLLSGFGVGSMIVSASLYIGSRKDLLSALINR